MERLMRWRSGCLTLLVVVLPCAAGCNPSTFYPRRAFMNAERPSIDPESVEVLTEKDQAPTCAYEEMGTIVYDWARDGVFTTADRALKGVREKAADIGASGIYKL